MTEKFEVSWRNAKGENVVTEWKSLEGLRLMELSYGCRFQGFVRDEAGVIVRKDDDGLGSETGEQTK